MVESAHCGNRRRLTWLKTVFSSKETLFLARECTIASPVWCCFSWCMSEEDKLCLLLESVSCLFDLPSSAGEGSGTPPASAGSRALRTRWSDEQEGLSSRVLPYGAPTTSAADAWACFPRRTVAPGCAQISAWRAPPFTESTTASPSCTRSAPRRAISAKLADSERLTRLDFALQKQHAHSIVYCLTQPTDDPPVHAGTRQASLYLICTRRRCHSCESLNKCACLSKLTDHDSTT
jgi:hypothetical protein